MRPFQYHTDSEVILKIHFYGLVQDCSIPSALAMEIQQFWTKPSMYNENHITHESKKRKQKWEKIQTSSENW